MKTRITELLGIERPIIQAGMNYGAYPPLVAAVSNAGGLGILGAGSMTAVELRQNIKTIRGMTDRPFGVNLLATSPILDELIEVMIEEKIPVASYGRGDPEAIIERTKPYGIVNMPTIGAVRHAFTPGRLFKYSTNLIFSPTLSSVSSSATRAINGLCALNVFLWARNKSSANEGTGLSKGWSKSSFMSRFVFSCIFCQENLAISCAILW